MTEGSIAKADATSSPATADRRREPRQRRLHGEDLYAIFPVMHDRSGAKRWSVILSRGGRSIQLAFPYLKYGGEAPALAVAKACRDAIVAVVPPMTNRDMREIKRRNRAEGMPGVYHVAGDARHAESYVAQILLPDGHSRRRTFPVARHGETRARQLAEAERQRMMDEVGNIEKAALRSPAAVALDERFTALGQDVADGKISPGISRDAGEAPSWRVKVHAQPLRFGHGACALLTVAGNRKDADTDAAVGKHRAGRFGLRTKPGKRSRMTFPFSGRHIQVDCDYS